MNIVLRAKAGMPAGWMPPDLEGKWIRLGDVPYAPGFVGQAVAVPTDRYETRDDGQRAQVWEVGPPPA